MNTAVHLHTDDLRQCSYVGCRRTAHYKVLVTVRRGVRTSQAWRYRCDDHLGRPDSSKETC